MIDHEMFNMYQKFKNFTIQQCLHYIHVIKLLMNTDCLLIYFLELVYVWVRLGRVGFIINICRFFSFKIKKDKKKHRKNKISVWTNIHLSFKNFVTFETLENIRCIFIVKLRSEIKIHIRYNTSTLCKIVCNSVSIFNRNL